MLFIGTPSVTLALSSSACRMLNGVGFSACAVALWERSPGPITLVWSSKVTHTPFPSPVCHHSLLPCRPVPHPVSHCSTKFRVDNSVITQTLEMPLGSRRVSRGWCRRGPGAHHRRMPHAVLCTQHTSSWARSAACRARRPRHPARTAHKTCWCTARRCWCTARRLRVSCSGLQICRQSSHMSSGSLPTDCSRCSRTVRQCVLWCREV